MNNIKTFENFNNQNIFKFIVDSDIKSVKNYIDSGYDLNVRDKYGNTLLMIAAVANIEILELLLKSGADIDIDKQNNKGHTALFKAVLYDKTESVEVLLNAGADTEKQDDKNYVALILAAHHNKIEIVKLLLNAGAKLNKQNVYSEDALHCAIVNSNFNMVKLLLDAGIDIDKQDSKGETALILAAKCNNREITEILLDYHADEFILNNDGESFYDSLNDKNKQYFLKEYPSKVYNAIYHKYKKSFVEFVKDYNIKK